jgi:hypothetical protein
MNKGFIIVSAQRKLHLPWWASPCLLLFFLVLITPGTAAAQVSVSISPTSASLVTNATQLFNATVTGSSNTAITWQVNTVTGGNSSVGTIATTGLYVGPASVPNPASVTVTAISQADPTKSASATVIIGAASRSGVSYYVSTTGSDTSGAGTLASPWRTIQHAANMVRAGDTVNVRGGSYNESVTIGASGSVSAGLITFQSYPGETAIVDGTGLSIPNNQNGLINIANQSYLLVQGLEIRNYKSTRRNVVPVGIWVTGAGSNLQFLNNHIHDITVTATGCNANALGFAIYGTAAPASLSNITISGNQIDHLKTGCSESLTLDGNVENFAIVNNQVHDNNNIGIDLIAFEGVSPNPAYDQARNGLVSSNEVYNITSHGNPSYSAGCWCADGIYVDGGTQILVERNLVHNVDLGIEMASEHAGKNASYITARDNLIYFGNSAGISIGGYASGVGGSDHITIVNNTLFKNDGKNTGSGEFQIQYHATNNLFENNIAYAGSQALLLNDYTSSTPSPCVLNYNVYYAISGSSNSTFVWQHVTHTTYATYLSASAQDSQSSFGDPKLVNLTTPDLHVLPSSPVVNKGINLGSSIVGSGDYAGSARVQGANIDIGAYEQ